MIILLCGRDQCGLNAHSVDLDSMRIESWSSVDRPLQPLLSPGFSLLLHLFLLIFFFYVFYELCRLWKTSHDC